MNSNILTTRNIKYFNYDELTWDVVAALPRDTPLILPLGSGYDLSLLADQLSNPSRIGLLPAFPFGWRGSGLEVPCLTVCGMMGLHVYIVLPRKGLIRNHLSWSITLHPYFGRHKY